MKNLFKVVGEFTEDKGLEIETQAIPIVKDNDKAIVLDTENFNTVYKKDEGKAYVDYLDKPRKSTYSSSVVKYEGYFSEKQKGVESVSEEVNKFLTDKRDYYDQLIIKFDNQDKE